MLRCFFALLFLCLGACSTLQPLPKGVSAAAQKNTALEISGRFSVHYAVRENSDEKQSVVGNFVWQETTDATTVNLNTPTGQTLAQIVVRAEGTQLTAQGKTWQASSPEALTQQQFGWSLPVTAMRTWLNETARDNFAEEGWQIVILRRFAENLKLPKQLEAKRYAPLELTIKLVIDERSDVLSSP